MISNWTNLLARRDLLRELTLSELRSQSQESRFGWVWWLVDPLIMMLIYWGVVVGILGRGQSYTPYPVFVLCAVLPWKHLSSSLNASAKVLRAREGLIKSIAFPTMALPLTVVVAGFSNFLFGVVILVLAALGFAMPLGTPLVQLPALLLAQIALVAGFALIVACVGALARDLPGFMTHVLRVGFYCSPTLYGLDLAQQRLGSISGLWGEWLPRLFVLNPLALLITGYREAVFYGRFMSGDYWLLLTAESVLVLAAGYRIYQYFDRRVIKFL